MIAYVWTISGYEMLIIFHAWYTTVLYCMFFLFMILGGFALLRL